MATLETLKGLLCGPDGSQGIIQDESFYASITDRINDAVSTIAAGVRMPDGMISPPLPDLFDTDTIATATDAAYKSLPTDYQRNLIMIADSNGDQIAHPRNGNYYSFSLFLRQVSMKDFTEAGDAYIVCVKGTKLYYQGIPSTAKTLTLHFYRAPVDMVDKDDELDGIPEHLQKRLIQHYVAAQIFGEALEDLDPAGQGYKYHINKFYEAMTDLIDFVGIDAEPEYFGSEDWDD